MKFYARLYSFYNSLVIKLCRAFLLIALIPLSFLSLTDLLYPNFIIAVLSIFLIFEIFFKFKVERLMPRVLVSENSDDPLNSFTLLALSSFLTSSNTQKLIENLLNKPQVKFILEKADIERKQLKLVDIDKNELAKEALHVAKQANGKYVTTMDLITSHLLLSESQTKLLFSKKLKPEDLEAILIWARNRYKKEENPKRTHLFWGEGIAEDWVYGWTNETQKYMLDLTSQFINKKKNAIGRINEYNQLLESLYAGKSTILVGESGSGKTAVVEHLARESFTGLLSKNLFHQRIFQLMVDAFMAGATTQGELEQRLDNIIQEVSHSGNIIVFIPNIDNILGNSSFNLNISGALIPYIKNGNIRIIATATPASFKKYVEANPSFMENFSVIKFENLDRAKVLEILFRKASFIEEKTKTVLTYKAILSSFNFANSYIKEKVLPGSAVILLEDTANAVSLSGKAIVEEQNVEEQITKKVHMNVGEPKQVEKNLLLNLEKQMHLRVIGQDEAVSTISEAIRRVRAGLKTSQKPISFLFLGPTGVGKTETAKALAQSYFGDDKKMIRLDMSEFSGIDGEKRLLGAPPGQGDEKGQLTESIYDNPYSMVLLDEFEKADQKILDLFLQVFDDGRLTDNKGKTVSFINSVIIATSNAASEYIREQIGKGVKVDGSFYSQLLEYLQTKQIFKPELLNRFDAIIVFKPLNQAQIQQIVKILLTEFTNRLKEKDIVASFDEKIVAKIANEGFDKDFGARPLRRFIQDNIEDLIAQKMLKDEIKRGDKILISVDTNGNIEINK
ncbi:MAG: ATP-dependent Clp protease ATP-binding subunit [Candidatus Levybacteria bacterium]|nr:ATP-dependent Clp protease ATP-binding subunit [Candidatus Levybacteria bacterium]